MNWEGTACVFDNKIELYEQSDFICSSGLN